MFDRNNKTSSTARSAHIRKLAQIVFLIFLMVPVSGVADSNFNPTGYSTNSATASIRIRLRIIPSSSELNPLPQNPFSTVSTALKSDQLYSLELDPALSSNFSIDSERAATETTDEMLNRLERAVNKLNLDTSTARNTQVVLTLSAG